MASCRIVGVIALASWISGCSPADPLAEPTGGAPEQIAMDWLEGSGVADEVEGLSVVRVDRDPLGMTHVRLQQSQDGVAVQGGQIVVHIDAGEVFRVTDRLVRGHRVDTVPSVDSVFAESIAQGGTAAVASSTDLILIRHSGALRLAWQVQLEDLESATPSRPMVLIDAHTGEELFRYDNLQTVRDRNTYTANNGTSLPGTLVRSEGSGAVSDQAIDAAHDNAGHTYDYYWSEQGRDSWDGAGASITSTAHYGSNYENAFWDGSQMVYGDGGFYFYPLSLATDVVSHEITHAVTERTAGLLYYYESGGLNEATSDIMGAVVESYSRGWAVDADTWMVGEDITRPALGDALRFMDNPPADGISIDNYADYYDGLDVHYSSGIANKAFYLMATDPALDIQAAGDIWFRALSFYMTESTTFEEASVATADAAADLYGDPSDQVDAVRAAWAAVGVMHLDYVVFDTIPNLSAADDVELRFSYDIPPASGLVFETSGGTGDADLYVSFGSEPTRSVFDCRSWTTSNSERCVFVPPSEGTYHVMIHAWDPFSGVTLTASVAGVGPEVCDDGIDNDLDGDADCGDPDCDGEVTCPLSGAAGTIRRFEFPRPEGAVAMDFELSGGTGNADLYVRRGRPVRQNRYNCRSNGPDNEESCHVEPATANVYHVVVYGASDYEGVMLTATPTVP